MNAINPSSRKLSSYTKKHWRRFIKRFYPIIVAFLACFLPLTYLTPSAAVTDNSLIGVYYGDGNVKDINNLQALESWQGKKFAVVNVFANWCDETGNLDNLFDNQLPNIWNNQNVPMVSWEPFFCINASNGGSLIADVHSSIPADVHSSVPAEYQSPISGDIHSSIPSSVVNTDVTPLDTLARAITPADIEVRAANGEFDDYLNQWADRMKIFLSGPDGIYHTGDDRRVYIRFAHEMNGNWYPWSPAKGNNDPADFIRMWRRVKSLFYNKGMEWSHVQWVWCVNYNDYGGVAESVYPGDEYVDWVSISGYNWGASQAWSTWITPEQTFGPMLKRLRALTKRPISISEFASTTETTSGTNVVAKSNWIANAFKYALDQDIKMVVWFNDYKETDWTVFGGQTGDGTFEYKEKTYRTYAAYKSAAGLSSFVPSDPANPRLLTDAKFSGY